MVGFTKCILDLNIVQVHDNYCNSISDLRICSVPLRKHYRGRSVCEIVSIVESEAGVSLPGRFITKHINSVRILFLKTCLVEMDSCISYLQYIDN